MHIETTIRTLLNLPPKTIGADNQGFREARFHPTRFHR